MNHLGAQRYTKAELKQAGFKKVGSNVQISSRASIYGAKNISLGNNVRIDDFSTIIATNELSIGNYVSIHNYCFLGARWGISIGDYVTLAPSCKIFSASDDYSGAYMTGVMVPEDLTGGNQGKVVIEEHTIIGTNSIILPNITLASGTSIGANSLVKSDTEAWHIYHGTPAKIYKPRSRELLLLEKTIY
ncbi:acyltransferase [Pseudoalteromonas sp. MMG005]|uniref:acyltransferase n=1 Tax=Pseudoalteromonas sp. MMG005 TaxID=2822682 RepID=UPI001B3A4102|nr:acyltransferase [Pseudoalteromonas sp. MMG005]MBQ4846326.1 acyltransferase [Pseudoalteromonas sp. MMG005]